MVVVESDYSVRSLTEKESRERELDKINLPSHFRSITLKEIKRDIFMIN